MIRSPSADDVQRQHGNETGEGAALRADWQTISARIARGKSRQERALLYEFQKDGIPALPLDHPREAARAW